MSLNQNENIFPEDAELKAEYTGGHWLEGPSQGPDGKIYFSDITQSWLTGMQGGHLNAFDPKTGKTEVILSPSAMSNGIVFDSAGNMVVAHGADFGGRYISRIDMKTKKSTIVAGLFNGRPFNAPNDVDVDAEDRIYFTDPRYFGHEAIEQPVMGVYRIDNDGNVELVVADCARPNGLAVSPNGQFLYVVEHNYHWLDRRVSGEFEPRNGDMQIIRYEIQSDGKINNRHVLVDFDGEGGGPDGIEVDNAGNIFAAVLATDHGVRVYNPDGREITRLSTPLKPANLTLAQDHNGKMRLYIAASSTLYSIPVMAESRHF